LIDDNLHDCRPEMSPVINSREFTRGRIWELHGAILHAHMYIHRRTHTHAFSILLTEEHRLVIAECILFHLSNARKRVPCASLKCDLWLLRIATVNLGW
jgi:hypothetical protein